MNLLDLLDGLDEIESAKLGMFASVNNVSHEEAAAMLIRQRLDEWADSIIDIDDEVPGDAKH